MTTCVILPIETEFSILSSQLLGAAQQLPDSIHVLIHASANTPDYLEHFHGLERVETIYSLDYANEPLGLSQFLSQWVKAQAFTTLLASDELLPTTVLPRVAAKLGVGQVSHITKVLTAHRFQHPIYAGNILETVEVEDERVIATVRGSAFAPASVGASKLPQVIALPALDVTSRHDVLQVIGSASAEQDLNTATRVIGIGRGVGTEATVRRLEQLAAAAGFACGGTRAIVDAGWMSNDQQIGQTGKVIAPDLYLAVGISGAIQHLAGIRQAKTIFAVNCDADAPIMRIADYALTGKIEDVLPALEAALVKE